VLKVAADDGVALGRAAYTLGCLGEDIIASITLADRSLDLSPSSAGSWVIGGWLRLWAGQPDSAIEHFKAAINPRGPFAGAFLGAGVGCVLASRFNKAEAMLLRSLQGLSDWGAPYRWLASCYAHMKRPDDAKEMIRALRAIPADVVPTGIPYRNPAHRELFLSGLRLAAGEEM